MFSAASAGICEETGFRGYMVVLFLGSFCKKKTDVPCRRAYRRLKWVRFAEGQYFIARLAFPPLRPSHMDPIFRPVEPTSRLFAPGRVGTK